MKGLAVVVPMKSGGAKSRLSSALPPKSRRRFSLQLLTGVLGAIEEAGLTGACYVVSSDSGALELASKSGASAVVEGGDDGVNVAVRRAVEAAGDPEAVLVLPSDLPLLRPSDVTHLVHLAEAGELDVVLAPSTAFDGTNALLFPGGRPFKLSYDDDSFWNHLAEAGRRGLSVGVCTLPGLTFDLDSYEDLRRLASSGSSRPAARFAREALG